MNLAVTLAQPSTPPSDADSASTSGAPDPAPPAPFSPDGSDAARGRVPAAGRRITLVSGARSAPTRAAPFEIVAAVARLIGEALELRQVFARVAEAALGAMA
jgi:hypothetical protein